MFYYYICIEAKYCTYQVLVNGFPVLIVNAERIDNVEKPINLYLVGINEIIISMKATEKDKTEDPPIDDISKILFEVKIKKYNAGERTGPDDGEIIEEVTFNGKTSGKFEFENDYFDFSEILKDSPVITNIEELKSYGVELFNLSIERKFNKLVKEFEPKIIDTATAFFQNKNNIEKQFKDQLKSKFFRYPNEIIELSKDQINAIPWCDNMIFQLVVNPDSPLIWAYSNKEHTGKSKMHVFVAMVNGALKVVR